MEEQSASDHVGWDYVGRAPSPAGFEVGFEEFGFFVGQGKGNTKVKGGGRGRLPHIFATNHA
jgi:hypothetical protein